MLAEASRVRDRVYSSVGAAVVVQFVIAQSGSDSFNVLSNVAGPIPAVIVAQFSSALCQSLVKTWHVAVLKVLTLGNTDCARKPSASIVNQQQVMDIEIGSESAHPDSSIARRRRPWPSKVWNDRALRRSWVRVGVDLEVDIYFFLVRPVALQRHRYVTARYRRI